ncbi:unnamed protein product [Ectocarpus sp. 8 AP-2014]
MLRLNVYAPVSLATTGLLGNNNGELGDDFKTLDGEAVNFATAFPTVEEGTDYCTTNWCTTEGSSMFTYAEGESHGTYDLCDAVYSAFVLPDVIPTAIVELCGDNTNCIVDALLAGEEVGRATLEAETENRIYQEEVGGLCASNSFSSTGTPPCEACPAGEISGTGATTCTREGLVGLNIPDNIAAAMNADAVGGFAGPGSLIGVPAMVTDVSALGSASLFGMFVRDDGAALPASASVFFYIQDIAQPDDFVRGQEALNPTTGEFSTDVMNIPSSFSRLFLSFVITDPAEALDDGTDAGAVFVVSVWNCDLPLTIILQWSDTSVDLDLSVTEPGGKLVDAGTLYADNNFDDAVDDVDDADVASAYNAEYYGAGFLNASFNAVEGDYIASVHLFDGSDAAWSLIATISGEVVLFEEGDLTRASPTSADITVSWTDFDSTCWDELLE